MLPCMSWKAMGICLCLAGLEHRENILQEEFQAEKYFFSLLLLYKRVESVLPSLANTVTEKKAVF